MTSSRGRTWGGIALAVLLVVGLGGLVGVRVGSGLLKAKMVAALGPGSEIAAVHVGWGHLDVEGLRIKGQPGWPAADELRAERVVIVPRLRSLFSGPYQVAALTVVKPYLAVLRTQAGHLQVVPSLPPPSLPPVQIAQITLQDGVVELFDATVARPPLKLRLEQVQATVKDVVVPTLTGRSPVALTGVVKGVQRDGRAAVTGWVELATQDAAVKIALRSVDLVALQAYLLQAGEPGVRKGTLDLELDSTVSQHRLQAPGTVTFRDLALTPGTGVIGTFLGVPRAALVALLQDQHHDITVHFVLAGNLDDPRFSLHEALGTRVAVALAEHVGIHLGEVPKEVGALGAQAAKGVGGALQRLFGGSTKR